MKRPIVFDIADDHVIVALPRDGIPFGLGLDLHVVIPSDGSGSVAWWEIEAGECCGAPVVGLA